MHNVTLISTRHHSLGECNSSILLQIIEAINPEVIFEEIPSNSDKHGSHFNLEDHTISMYSLSHKIKRVPVDSVEMPPESFFQKLEDLYKLIENLEDINGSDFRDFTYKNRECIRLYGFEYLNSIDCININDKINDAIEQGLKKINNDELFQIYQLWKGTHEKRENEMLLNIYRYSKENNYDNAVFTLGSAHRKGIIAKIQEYEKIEEPKLNWIILGS